MWLQGTLLHDQAELKQSAALNILLTELKNVLVSFQLIQLCLYYILSLYPIKYMILCSDFNIINWTTRIGKDT